MATAFLCGLFNVMAAGIVVITHRHQLKHSRAIKILTIIIATLLTVGTATSEVFLSTLKMDCIVIPLCFLNNLNTKRWL